jgi:hypothetical protein
MQDEYEDPPKAGLVDSRGLARPSATAQLLMYVAELLSRVHFDAGAPGIEKGVRFSFVAPGEARSNQWQSALNPRTIVSWFLDSPSL